MFININSLIPLNRLNGILAYHIKRSFNPSVSTVYPRTGLRRYQLARCWTSKRGNHIRGNLFRQHGHLRNYPNHKKMVSGRYVEDPILPITIKVHHLMGSDHNQCSAILQYIWMPSRDTLIIDSVLFYGLQGMLYQCYTNILD